MAFVNQGSRPNYPSTEHQLKYQAPAYDSSNHTIWVGGAIHDLSEIKDVDFEWPRKFCNDLSEVDREHLISNLAGHLGGVKSDEIKNRQLCVFEKVSKEFAAAVAKEMNYTYPPCS